MSIFVSRTPAAVPSAHPSPSHPRIRRHRMQRVPLVPLVPRWHDVAVLDISPLAPGPHGPTGAAFGPRRRISTRTAPSPITEPVAKLGGRPVWLERPTWPIGACTASPMMFIGQMPIPGAAARMAYLFMTDDDDCNATGFMPEGGDTALLVQPGGRIPAFVRTASEAAGPSLWRRGSSWWEKIPVELRVDLSPLEPADERLLEAAIDAQDSDRAGAIGLSPEDCPLPGSHLGGRPHFWQPACVEVDDDWQFFFQLECGDDGYDSTSFTLNFGEGGTGYAFLSPDHLEGRFYWDCM